MQRKLLSATSILLIILMLAGCALPSKEIFSHQPYLESAIPLEEELSQQIDFALAEAENDASHEMLSAEPRQLSGLLTNIDSVDGDINVPKKSSPAPSTSSDTKIAPSPSTSKGTTNKYMSGAFPTVDFAVQSDKTYALRVTAPTGAKVQVTVNDETYNLKEQSKGFFKGNYKLPKVSGTVNLGQIVYTMSYNGSISSIRSEGSLFAVGEDTNLKVQVINSSATAFKNPKVRGSGFITTLKKGAVDYVTGYYGTMYRLSSAGWVDASAVQPLTQNIAMDNKVSGVSFENRTDGEAFILKGTTHPPYIAKQTKDSLTIRFARTSGVGSIPVANSKLFSSADVTTKDGATTITFKQSNPGQLWGYLVSYSNGTTTILCRQKPKLAEGDKPLTGIVVAVDAGHGGKDTGALGLGAGGKGLVEKQINLITANYLKEALEEKGATVVMIREGDTFIELSDRVAIAQQNRVHFMISLHCNSAPSSTGKGVEVYYHEPIAGTFASNVSTLVSSYANRTNRGAKHSCYVVSLISYAPSILVEMGFMTNSSDYKSLTSKSHAEATVKGIVDAVIHQLK